MNKQEYIELFNSVNPDFFEKEYIKKLPDNTFFDEMILPLDEFEPSKYEHSFGNDVSFGYYNRSFDDLLKAVARVDQGWTEIFKEDTRVFCGYIGGELASFCIVEDMGMHCISGNTLKIGGPGCVGTLPEHRNKGIGLTMVKLVTQILKDEGYDQSYIHFTGVASWYEKLGYRKILSWNRNGIA